MMYTCPSCGSENDMGYALRIAGKIKTGGCLDCFETMTTYLWWQVLPDVVALDMVKHPELYERRDRHDPTA